MKPKFLQKTASERAGLISPAAPAPRTNGASPATLTDDELWRQLRESPVAKQIVLDAEQANLAVRRELVAKLEAARDMQAQLVDAEAKRRAGLAARREAAERAFREALDAELRNGIPIGDPGRAECYALERQLEKTADARIDELRIWLEREQDLMRLVNPGFIATHEVPLDDRHVRIVKGGYDADDLAAIRARMQALRDAAYELRPLKLLALSPDEVLAELRRIYATIPTLETHLDGGLRRDVAPKFLTAVSAHT